MGLACVGKLGLRLTVNCLIISLQIPSPSSVLGAWFPNWVFPSWNVSKAVARRRRYYCCWGTLVNSQGTQWIRHAVWMCWSLYKALPIKINYECKISAFSSALNIDTVFRECVLLCISTILNYWAFFPPLTTTVYQLISSHIIVHNWVIGRTKSLHVLAHGAILPRYINNLIILNFALFMDPLITVAAWSKAWTIFARSKAGIVVSNPTRGTDVCILCLC
jgi:S-adenosylmethionine/arginine decarboxylase-like enzyme